ncbi:hypothetical protein [Petrocella sp. FN5]|uniref:hypothetical protein n=1 Tax=Petrocella sp. FN5 TaxID=3032002 RepID=UPI0023DAAA11|nr:hypothetical protein [Petrocella sp. FN5]MDF1616873.1 hypothetical protein [Petrocella sp. FN5]
MISLLVFIFAGCGNNKEDEVAQGLGALIENVESLTDETLIQDTMEVVAQVEEAVTKEDNFASIVQLSNKFEDFYNVLEEAGEDIDDFAFLGDMMTFSTLQMINADIELEQALHLMADSWEDAKKDMPNGAGQYDSALVKEGDQYHYSYNAYWNSGKVSKTMLTYDPKEKTIDYSRVSDDESDTNRYMQQFIDKDGKFYVTYSEKNLANNEGGEIIIFFDGTQASYARNVKIEGYDVTSRLDIILDKPNTWEALVKDKIYTTMFIFDGTQVNYQNN